MRFVCSCAESCNDSAQLQCDCTSPGVVAVRRANSVRLERATGTPWGAQIGSNIG